MAMGTGAKIVIGCTVAAMGAGIVGIVVLGGAAWWIKGKAQDVVGKAQEIEKYEKQANANPFTEPADGLIQEPRLVKFLNTRKAIYAVYERHRTDFEGMENKKQADFSDITKFAGLIGEIRLAQAQALAAEHMSESEYRYLQLAVYKSAWAGATQKETGKQTGEAMAEALKQMGDVAREGMKKVNESGAQGASDEQMRQAQQATDELARQAESLKVPEQNVALFRKYEADIQKYAMHGLAMIGL
jgi:hypothetical protein